MQRVKRILIVEDDSAMKTILVDFLGKQGYAVTAVSSATKALDFLKALPGEKAPNIVLSDVKLGTVSGIELARQVSNDHAGLPIVLFSVFDQIEQEALAAGAKRFLRKPFSLESLENVLSEELKKIQSKVAIKP